MSAAREAHRKTQGTGQWEEVHAPIDCSYYQIVDPNGNSFEKCSDPEDASTCTTRNGFSIIAPAKEDWRWNHGDLITYVKSNTPLDLYFLR